MTSTTRIFFIGVGTTLAILSAGFGGGLMFAKNAMEQPRSANIRSAADRLPAVRVVLPTSAEAAQPAQAPAASTQLASFAQPAASPEPVAERPPGPSQAPLQATAEDQQADRMARRKAEAEDRVHRRRLTERKARRDAARVARRLQQEDQSLQRREPGILAFDDEQSRGSGLFGH